MLPVWLLLTACSSDVGVTQIPDEVTTPEAELTVSPTVLQFEGATHGDFLTFSIANTGEGRLVVEDLDVVLSGSLFSVSDPALRVLDGGESTDVTVTWLGDAYTDGSGVVTVITDAPDGVVDVFVDAVGVERLCDPEAAPFGGGVGTEEDPFQLCSPSHLAAIEPAAEGYYQMMDDIDLSGVNHIPILDFQGVFDGDGHAITGWTQTSTGSLALFNSVYGTVMNLEVAGPVLTFGRDSATVANLVRDGGTIENVHVTDAVLRCTDGMMGGVVNVTASNTLLSNVSFDGTITTSSETGFLGGVVHSCRGLCTQLSSTGSIDGGNAWKVGGITVHVVGTLASSVSHMSVSGGSRVGGLAAVLSGTIEDSYADGPVSGIHWVGGLVGESYAGTTPMLVRSYSASSIVSSTSHSGVGGAGLLAWNNNPTAFVESVWDVDATGQLWSAGGTGLSDAQMRDPDDAAFDTWGAPWVHVVGERPALDWE